jgi:hypothetical protein
LDLRFLPIQRKTAVQINAVPATAPITTPAIPPPDSDGDELAESAALDEAGADEEMEFGAADVEGVADADGPADVDGVAVDVITPNFAAMVIGSDSQQEAVFPQHQVVEFAVPSQGVISWVPPLT